MKAHGLHLPLLCCFEPSEGAMPLDSHCNAPIVGDSFGAASLLEPGREHGAAPCLASLRSGGNGFTSSSLSARYGTSVAGVRYTLCRLREGSPSASSSSSVSFHIAASFA